MHMGKHTPSYFEYQLARRRRTITLGILGTLIYFRHFLRSRHSFVSIEKNFPGA